MAKNKFNKNRSDDKSSNAKTSSTNPIETDNDMDKPTRGIPRI